MMKFIVNMLGESYGMSIYENEREFLDTYEDITDEEGFENVLKAMEGGYEIICVRENGETFHILSC